MGNLYFGYAWIAFALSVAVHVTDEAAHDFLSFYNPAVHAIRARLPFWPAMRLAYCRQWCDCHRRRRCIIS